MKYVMIFLFFIVGTSLQAEEKSKASQIIENTVENIGEFVNQAKKPIVSALDTSTRVRQRNSMGGLIQYSAIDFVVPSKLGISFYNTGMDRNTQYELQYLKGSFSLPFVLEDLGSIDEQRISILKRNFWDNSNLNWYYGLSYNSLVVHIGSKFLASVPVGKQVPEVDLLAIQTLGLDLGFGSRWYFENSIVLGVDWIGWSQPLIALKKQNYYSESTNSQNDRGTINKFMNVAAYFPRFSVLKLSLGYSF